jgi:hypothetical protein
MRREQRIGIVVGLALAAGCSTDARPADGLTFASASLDDGPSSSDTNDEAPTSVGDGDTGDGDTGDGDGDPAPLPCDPDFALTPNPPGTGALLNVAFTDLEPLAYVDLIAAGPGSASIQWAGITTEDPWTWNWTVTGLTPGVWTFTFGAGESWLATATCQAQVLDTGIPPDPPPDPPMGACAGKVCGDDDGQGGACDTCPMVGECLDPPSPYGPNGLGQWSCLDNASCNPDNGICRIWCPGEPCNNAEHPDGCPQGVETCWVDATIGSYEEACKSCCESRFHQPTMEYACWDEGFNLCRYPTDCGLPLW